MAITKAQQSALTNSSFAAGGVWSPATVSIAGVTPGNLLVVVSGLWDSGRGTGVPQGIHSDSNGTLVGATNANPNLNAAGSPPGWPVAPQISHILSAAAGTHTITPVVVNSGGDGYLSAIEFSGGGAGTWTQVDGGTGYAGSNTIGAVDTVTATTVGTAAQVGDLVISVTAIDGDPTALGMSNPSNGSWTNLVTTSTSGDTVTIGAAYRIATVAGAQSAVWDSVDAACQQNFAAIAVYRFTPSGPTINTPPASTIAKVGSTAGFSVSGTASAGSLTYQWQKRTSGAWADIGGATSASYTTPALAAGDSAGYRCNVTDSNGTVATDEAVLTVALPQKLWRRQPTGTLSTSRPFEPLPGKAKFVLVSAELFGASDVSLAGSAIAQASAAAALQLLVGLAGAAQAQASASGTLSVGGAPVNLAGDAGAQAAASGAMNKAVGLAVAAAVQAAAGGSLRLDVGVAGSAGAQASAGGLLALDIGLAGAAGGQATASGGLALSVGLVGVALAQGSASGALAKSIALSGAAVAVANASGQLALSVALSGTALAQATAGGSLTGAVALSGTAAAQAGASGTLWLTVPLAGSALAQAQAGGGLVLTVLLGGQAQAQAAGAGALAVPVLLSGAAGAQSTVAGSLSVTVSNLLSDKAYTAQPPRRTWRPATVQRTWQPSVPRRSWTARVSL